MDKSIQNCIWATLPKDFKKEVRKEYKIACDIYEADPYNIRAEANYKLMEKVFGGDNLTSEEKPQPKFMLGDKVKILYSPDHQGKISVVENVIRSSSNMSPYCYALSGILGTFFEKCLAPYAEPETKEETMDDAKEQSLCELLEGHEGERLFYTPMGDVIYCGIDIIHSVKSIKIKQTRDSALTHCIRSDGRLDKEGECLLFPSRALYEQYPLDPYTAWLKWQEEQKKFGLDIKIETYFEGKYGWEDCDDNMSCLHFRTPADRDKCIEEINAIIEKYSKKQPWTAL